MKKCVSLVTTLLLGMIFFTGCGAEEAAAGLGEKPVTVTFWHYYNDAQKSGLDNIIAEYNATVGKEKNVVVEAVGLGSVDDITTKVASVLKDPSAGLEKPNMFLAYRDMLQEIGMEDSDAFLDYNKYFTTEELEGYYTDFLEEGRFGEALYIMPVAKSTELLFMNQTTMDLFFEENPQYSAADFETWEKLSAMAEAFYQWTDAKTPLVTNDGMALIGLDNFSNYFITQYSALGGEMYQLREDGTAQFQLAEANVRKLFENYYVPFSKGYYGGTEKYCSDDLRQDNLCGYIGSVASVTYFPETVYGTDGSEKAVKMGIYPYPYFSGAEKTAIQQGAGIVTLKSDEAENQAVADFIKWISEEKGTAYASMLSYMPTSKVSVEAGKWDIIEDENIRNAVETGTEQIKGYHLVRGFDFVGAYQLRGDLEDYFKSFTRQGREEYLGYLQSGMSEQEAALAMEYEEKASEFYQGILGVFQ